MRTSVAIALLLGLVACGRASPGTAAGPGPAKLNAPPAAHLVARAYDASVRLRLLDDGVPMLDAGFLVYELRPAGAPILFGELASYEPLLPPSPFDPAARASRQIVSGTRLHVVLDGLSATDLWDGAKWTHTLRGRNEHIPDRHGPPGNVLPKRYRNVTWTHLADETWVGLGTDTQERQPTSVVVKPPSTDLDVIPIGIDAQTCASVPSADGRAYAICEARERHLLRLEGRRWVEIPVQHLSRPGRTNALAESRTTVAVGADGTVWYEDAEEPLHLRRFLPGGHHDDLELPKEAVAWPAAFHAESVVPATEERPRQIEQLLPLRSGEIWAVLSTLGYHVLVYRLGGPAPPGSMYVGSELDQRMAVANALGPVAATGHCAPVFVPLVTAHGASFPTDRLAARREALARAMSGKLGWFVIGWHGEHRAAGVLLLNEEEETITQLVDAFSDDPTAPPRPSCTPPVIERQMNL